LLFVLLLILNYIFFNFFFILKEMNRKSEFIWKYGSRYKVVSLLKKIIISDFAEMNSSVDSFLLLLKIVFEFQLLLGIYYYYYHIIIIGFM
jgi:hypothetical protein